MTDKSATAAVIAPLSLQDWPARPGLLVSVRSPKEARIAAVSGADVIDVKEPRLGSLGSADSAVVTEVVDQVKRKPVTVALGELIDLRPDHPIAPVSAVKAGLSGCRGVAWRERFEELAKNCGRPERLVAVVYADFEAARAPHPEELLESAVSLSLGWLLLDTWNKEGLCVLDTASHWLESYLRDCRAAGLSVALAGGLPLNRLEEAIGLGPDLVGLRGAVCAGGRIGRLNDRLVREAHRRVTLAKSCSPWHDRLPAATNILPQDK